MMSIETYLDKLGATPETMEFAELLDVVDAHYTFTETAFDNGSLQNKADENVGSCKLFSFAQLHDLNEEETLACFGNFYREDVLQNPNSDNHQNIRNFMKSGWSGITFNGLALQRKEQRKN